MSAEALYATTARLYEESSIGNGTPTGNVVDLPSFGAAAAKQVRAWETRLDAFRAHRSERAAIHTAWRLRTSHQIDISLAAWIITKHLYDRGSNQWDARRLGMPSPSFCLQFQLEDGDLIEFRGAHIDELQISMPEGRAATLELSWHALERLTGEPLEAATQSFTSPGAVATNESAATFQTGAITDRATDAIPVHSAEWIMRRDLTPVQYGPTGVPTRIADAPWRIFAELVMPASTVTEAALAGQTGHFGLWVGPASADLEITHSQVKAFREQDPLKSGDFRDHAINVEFRPTTAGRLVNVAATI